MNDTLIGNLRSGGDGSEESGPVQYCGACRTPLSPNTVFCPYCGPPQPPGEEPEESGITLQQAFIRIGILTLLFMTVAYVKLDLSFDRLFSKQTTEETGENLSDSERPTDKDFEIIHTVTSPYANVREKPSTKSKIITVVEKGMNLEVLEDNGGWSRVRVFDKTGWISNKLLKSEVREAE
ncbi:hypothetical protein UZ36_00305 [Candidatus Nitromaritima sp. SCGC AAA799-C22]|nr:hypothetical protein UZ36_00305 [Candidatus Nitromaritima sp. SCGC AAA799-C22]